jgi:protein-tyrosine-phosphatase
VLFVCGQNSVRSPMAAACGRCSGCVCVASRACKGELDPFAVAAMAEIGIDIAEHRPVTSRSWSWEGSIRPDRHVGARGASPRARTRTPPAEVEYWPTADPTAIEGNREQRLDAYRAVRDQLMARIRARFAA